MPNKRSYPTVTDQFCGAGGSGQGARKAGAEVLQALNHWKLATETYNTNFPNTLVDCTDISACDPRRYYSTDILITSPECTTHTPAGGNKHQQVKKQLSLYDSGKIDPATERSRATMWDVCRFAEYHQYRYIIVENVVEAKTRWPLFENWLGAMHTLGYNHECIYHNSMHHHPTPQSRDRMYVVFWKKGLKAPNLNYMPLAYCPACECDVHAIQTWKRPDVHYGKYRKQYVYCCPVHGKQVEPYYYAAFNCIDWSNLGTRIGDRKKPLSSNSVKRINIGLEKYGNIQLIINDQQSTGIGFRVNHIGSKIPTLTTDHKIKLFSPPFIIKGEHTKADGMTRHAFETTQAQLTKQSFSVCTPPFLVDSSFNSDKVRSSFQETFTNTSHQSTAIVQAPFILESKGTSTARSITSALSTQTTSPYLGLVSNEAWNSFIHYNYGKTTLSHITEELGACTCTDRYSVVSYKTPSIEDCYYRMLFPREVHKAMAFGDEYIILGSGRDKVKQLGNAVTPPVMEWIIGQIMECLN